MTMPPWSYSALDCFDNCPRMYYHKYVLKEKEPENEVTKHGNEVHKAIENSLKTSQPLPEAYKDFEKYVTSVWKHPGHLYVELPLAVNEKLQPCGFFAPEVYGRGKADVVKILGPNAWVGDWKTGKVKEKSFQVGVFAAFIFRMFPEVHKVSANNIWLQAKKIGTPYTFLRSYEGTLWRDILAKVNIVAQAFNLNRFPERPSGLCGYCPVVSCPHNKTAGRKT